jgi:hypothetical protein
MEQTLAIRSQKCILFYPPEEHDGWGTPLHASAHCNMMLTSPKSLRGLR